MTAKGKINASNIETGMRIIVKLNSTGWEGENVPVTFSRTKTGENVVVATVTGKTFRGAQGPYEARGKYIIETAYGSFEAATIQTMFLAPEDAAGVKRAHAEAVIEDAAREEEIALREQADDASDLVELEKVAEAIVESADAKKIDTAAADRLNRRMGYKLGAFFAPREGDVVTATEGGRVGIVSCTSPTAHTVVGIPGTPDHAFVGVYAASEFRKLWHISQSYRFESRAARCENEWHRTGPARGRMLCPECPVW